MTYVVRYNTKFAVEFANYPEPQQFAVLNFANTFQNHGLSDFARYEGKISPSWSGLETTDPVYVYTNQNNLWHYHIGIPNYRSVHGKYKTSDVVLHFEWPDWKSQGDTIHLVDTYDHHLANGEFYIPPPGYLTKEE